MSAARREYETTVAMESRSIKNIKNLKYYIYNPSTGEIITNLETETSEEKANEIKNREIIRLLQAEADGIWSILPTEDLSRQVRK